jgi:hypothetical protein
MVIRWLARITGIMLGLMVVAFAMEKGIPSVSQLRNPESWRFIAMVVMLLGAILAWRREALGGLLMIVGFIALWAIDRHFPGIWFGVFPLAGLLHLLAWAMDRDAHSSDTSYSSY